MFEPADGLFRGALGVARNVGLDAARGQSRPVWSQHGACVAGGEQPVQAAPESCRHDLAVARLAKDEGVDLVLEQGGQELG